LRQQQIMEGRRRADQDEGGPVDDQAQQAPSQRNRQGGQGRQQGRPGGQQRGRQDGRQAQQEGQGRQQGQQGGRQGGQGQPRDQQRQQPGAPEAQGGGDGQSRRGRRPVRRPRRDEEGIDRVDTPRAHQRGRQHRGGSNLAPSFDLSRTMASGSADITPMGPVGTDRIRVVPLGGVGEIGKNMTAVECGADVVLLDCGGKFPEENQRGIDLIIPDVSYIVERIRNFRGILITHGHEDHIGGLPYIVPQLVAASNAPIPIFGSPLAIGFIERKLLEARLEEKVILTVVNAGETVQLGNIKAEFIRVTHTIPDACAIALHTTAGTIVDTGDFKFDPTPVMGKPTDENQLRRIGDRGVLALFSDTTRVETEGSTPSEVVVQKRMNEVIGNAKGQVIIATFASNVSRIHMALNAAVAQGRKVAVAGRSMEQNARVAVELGYLDPPDGLLVPLDDLLRQPKEKRIIVVTGSQGEAAAALARIAAAEHPKIRVSRGDVIFVSATPIPGNEDTVTHTIDNLFRRGCEVVYSAIDRGVHVSGHAGRDELQKMINLVRPKFAVPVHGEYRHMMLYRDLCIATGIKRENVLLPEIGGVIEFTKDSASQKARVKAGNVLVDRLGDREDGQVVLRTRENLTKDGFVIVTVVIDRVSGELIAGPELVGQGLPGDLGPNVLREAEGELRRTLERRKKGSPQYGYIVQRTKETIGRALYRRSRSRPMILPVVTEL
jgi:ribonuclease J